MLQLRGMNRFRLWCIEKSFHFWLWWERTLHRTKSPNKRAEEQASFMGQQGTRCVKAKAGRVQLRKRKPSVP